MRHGVLFDPREKPGAPITTLSYEYADGHLVPEHVHEQDQVIYACRGVMTVRTSRGLWVVPPLRALWVPGDVPHSIAMAGAVRMKTLYLAPKLARGLPRDCCVLHVSPLLRELIVYACGFEALAVDDPKHARLTGVLIDQLQAAPAIPLELPTPTDPRAARIARILLDDPADARTLDVLCRAARASRRTIERVFHAETRMTFGEWRQSLRLLRAMQLLAGGGKVTTVALDAGYSTPSAFIAMFRRALGTTPSKYFGSAGDADAERERVSARGARPSRNPPRASRRAADRRRRSV